MSQNKRSLLATVGGLVGTAVVLPIAGWFIYSRYFIDHNLPLPNAVPAPKSRFNSPAGGSVSYYHDTSGSGRPLLLVHSVNAAASAHEMGPLFEAYQGERPVYAIDLPGYGFSERSDRHYTPELFAKTIIDLVKNEIGEPVDAVALSLGSEFLARAARAEPDWFHSITLISPTGFGTRGEGRPTQQASQNESSDDAYRLLAFPLWKQALFDLIVTRRSIRYFLEKSFVDGIPTEFVEYGYLTAHQPGAANVPLHFLSGRLFTPGIRTAVYAKITLPSLIIYDEDFYSPFDALPHFVASQENWETVRITPTRGLPHWERLPEVVEALNSFWKTAE